jgi:plastocyanin
MNKKYFWILGILVVALVIISLAGGKPSSITSEEVGSGAPTPSEPQAPNPAAERNLPPGVLPNQTPSATFEEGENVEIIVTDAGFAPATLAVKVGTVVTFKNLSSSDVWPASGPHPKHTGYPTKGGCFDSAFDACRGLKRDQSWSFKFDVVGSWPYHDHLNPSNKGTVKVTQ